MKRKNVLYIDIAHRLKKDIQNSVYLVGEMLPTEIELENMFDVSKITVRKAIEVLALQGYVEKKSGKGTTVISNRLFNKLSKGKSFSSILEEKGLQIEKKIVSIEVVNTSDEAVLNQQIVWIKATKVVRIYFVDAKPYILFTHYLPEGTFQSVKKNIEEQSMYQILAKENYKVDKINDSFSVDKITEEEKQLLEIENPSVLKRIRKSYNKSDELIEFSCAYYNSDMQPYEINFEV